MKRIFSDYVRSLEPDGEPLDDALDDLWTELRRLLRRELQRRGLWDRPPSYLGVMGERSWTLPEVSDCSGFPKQTRDALDELVIDCYVELFSRRLPNFLRYLRSGSSIEKVVVRSLRNLLQDRQKKHDRLGSLLYQRLLGALQRIVDSHRLYILEGGPKIHNATLFSFDPEAEAAPARNELLEPEVRRWNDELLLDWVSTESDEVASLTVRLGARVLALADAGIDVFRFKDLLDVLKHDVRARLAALWATQDLADAKAPAGQEKVVHQDVLFRLVEHDRLYELSQCVEKRLRHLDVQNRTREKLRKLWRFLEAFALAAAVPESTQDDDEAFKSALQGDTLPSNRELSRILHIRHERFPALFARLRVEVERCVRRLQTSPPTFRKANRKLPVLIPSRCLPDPTDRSPS